jgi:hypothetical protein
MDSPNVVYVSVPVHEEWLDLLTRDSKRVMTALAKSILEDCCKSEI